jgi:hypothetical protein
MVLILDKIKVPAEMQSYLSACGINTLSRFALLGDDVKEVKGVLKDELSLDSAEGIDMRMQIADVVAAQKLAVIQFQEESERMARARASETTLAVPVSEHKAIRRAYEAIHGELPIAEVPGRYYLGMKIDQATENDPIAEKLTEVCSRQENESEVWTPCFGQDGRMVTKKGAPQSRPKPKDAEELRNRHRIIGSAWVMVHLQHANRTWLQDLTVRDWEKITDYVVGDKVAKFQIRQEGGGLTQPPSWFIVLHYEYELRRKAYELITEGNSMTKH